MPLVAVHLFVFYFGILADDTPPVGLAAFAAAAISGGDPIRTGIQSFTYDIRTALLPFLFLFNTELLLIDVMPLKAVFVFAVAMMLFAAATQGYFLARSRIWESAALLLIAFTLFRPGFWLDYVEPPFNDLPGTQLIEMAGDAPANGDVRFVISGPDFDTGKINTRTIVAQLGAPGDGEERLKRSGLVVMEDDGKAVLEEPFPGTTFFQILSEYDFYGDTPVEITKVETEAERMPKEIFYIPALVLLTFVVLMQRRRQTVPAF